MTSALRPGAARLMAMEGEKRNGSVVTSIINQPTALAVLSDDDAMQLADGADRSDLADKDLETLASEARWHREQAEQSHASLFYHLREMGRRLLEAKGRDKRSGGMPQPEFILWAEKEVGVSKSEAYNYMALARPENVQRVGHLAPETSLRAALETIKEAKKEERAEARKLVVVPQVPDAALGQANIEVGDCADLPLPDNMVDLIVTSPPYGLGIDYANTDDDEGYGVYLDHVSAWSKEMYRVAGPCGRICLNVPLDVTYGGTKPIYADWVYALQEAGWQYRATVIWNEGNVSKSTARGSVDSPSSPHVIARVETIIVMYKGSWNLHRDADEHNLSHDEWLAWTNGVWEFSGEHRADHPAPFPEALPERCMKLFSFKDDVVLDPFLGSGTTAVVGRKLGRTVYGFDRSEQYIAQARVRISEVKA